MKFSFCFSAFGNAKTVRNDNSSRFGKYIDIYFSRQGTIEGARIQQYLLEKSRIVCQAADERNYHVFYCMLAGMQTDELQRLGLGRDVRSYDYLANGSQVCEGRDDAMQYAQIRSAMKVLMFADQEIAQIMQLLAALLHLGNVHFQAQEVNNLDTCRLLNESPARQAAHLLNVQPSQLIEALTTRTIWAHGDQVVADLSAAQALDVRDALVKGIYGRLFVFIVDKINRAICGERSPNANSIGVLDIFGFENFQSNSFEQFCINYANENLQQFFVQHIFKLEQEEYNLEAINWQHIAFVDNQAALDLIAVKTLNIMALIDEESKFPKGSDRTLLQKLHATHEKSANYVCDARAMNLSDIFCINHFAGPVCYATKGFLEKNRDTFSGDLVRLVGASGCRFLHQLFSSDLQMGSETRKRALTLGAQFKRSLEALMRQLERCHPFFVRCIKPNEQKRPMAFDRELCCKQLRYSGMMETIRIRRAGYPIRHTFVEFVERYRFLLSRSETVAITSGPHQATDSKHLAAQICKRILKDADYQLGNSKLFLKDAHDLRLEQERDRVLARAIVTLQKHIRGWILRRRFVRLRAAVVIIQNQWKVQLARRRYVRMRDGFERLQALLRSRTLTAQFQTLRRHLVALQALCRGYLIRQELRQRTRAAIIIQKTIRGYIARQRFVRLRAEVGRKQEMLRLREQEEASLARRMAPTEARKIAELNYVQRVKQLESKQLAEQLADRQLIAQKNAFISQLEHSNEEELDDSKLVDAMFDFLPRSDGNGSTSGDPNTNGSTMPQMPQAPSVFKDLENGRRAAETNGSNASNGRIYPGSNGPTNGSGLNRSMHSAGDDHDLNLDDDSASDTEFNERLFDEPSAANLAVGQQQPRRNSLFGEEIDDLSSYTFEKFAVTYFQGNASERFAKKALQRSLLPLPSQADALAAIALSQTIMRFMGDLPEPKFNSTLRDNTSVMTKVTATLGRNFIKSKEYLEAQLLHGGDIDSNLNSSSSATGLDAFNGASAGVGAVMNGAFQGNHHPLNGSNGFGQLNGTSSKPKRSIRTKLVSLTLKKKNKLSEDVRKRLQEDDIAADTYSNWLDARPTSNLEKLHFIIGHGILREELRDEIYCQICKQLTANPGKHSHARGWILLSLCIGCFAPSKAFAAYLLCFLRTGPAGYAAYCEQRLRRTIANGARAQPPSWLELQATKGKRPLLLPITFMDGHTCTLKADSATTAKELCSRLAAKIKLRDQFGFSLYIALFDKVSSLGAGGEHVMDAISQCEQYAKEQGAQERNAPWRLFYRKEIFAPWHDPTEDAVASNLIYQQLVRGVKYGEYRCDKDEDLAMLAAQQYYVDQCEVQGDCTAGVQMQTEQLLAALPAYIPDHCLNEHSVERWLQLIQTAYAKSYYHRERVSATKVKEDVVEYSKYKWPLLFSRFYEALRVQGPLLAKNDVIVAINWTGVYFVDDQEQVLLELSFAEIASASAASCGRPYLHSFSIHTVSGAEFVFQSPNAPDIGELINFFLDGLKKRSKYTIALSEYKADTTGALSVQQGDLLVLEDGQTGESVLAGGWVSARLERTGERGHVPTEVIYVLPTTVKPASTVLQLFAPTNGSMGNSTGPNDRSALGDSYSALAMLSAANAFGAGGRFEPADQQAPHTLEQYAIDHFRCATKYTLPKTLTFSSARRRNAEQLFKHAREPLKQPLLRKLQGREQLCQEACVAFTCILKYMGDLPSRRQRAVNELTDQIFEAPLKHDLLRDEIHCQLMKQLTDNKSRLSEERGWELMWLAAGLFVPSQQLLKELMLFLRSRRHPIAVDCLQRLHKTIRNGQRKYPPHLVEVEAIKHKTTQIFHKVYFPDDTDEAFEVDSSTRAKDFCQEISERLSLKSCKGFSLFVKITDKVISVPENDFFFDFVRYEFVFDQICFQNF